MENLTDKSLQITEIFHSIQGETSRAGLPSVFVRLQGCMLRCTWCDTDYGLDFKGGTEMTFTEIIEKVKSYNCDYITFTGGEPLRQKEVITLMKHFCDEGFTVTVETNGHVPVDELDTRIIKILDIKCPGSGMMKFNNYDNLKILLPHDEVKFVVKDRKDYEFAKDIIKEYDLVSKVKTILFSPVFGEMNERLLAEWILEDKIPVRLQLQIHKFIWEPDTRGV